MKRLVVTTSLLGSLVYRDVAAYQGRSQRGIILLNDTVEDTESDDLAVSGNLVHRLQKLLKSEAREFQAVAGEAVQAVMAMADGGNVGRQILSGKVVANNGATNSSGNSIADAFGSLYRNGSAKSTGATADEECKVETFDVFLVQDTSQTFQSDLNAAVKLMEDWILSIQDDYEGSRFGYGTFTDKPIPLSGFGPYGGWQNVKMQYDWCFEMEQSLVEDKDTFVGSLKKVWKKSGSGFDLLESQFEALLRAAMSVDAGWDDVRPHIDPNTHVRVIILITDAASHLNGDAASNIAKYNLPITLADRATLTTDGGWGSHAFSSTDMINYMKEKSYKKLADLIAKETFGSGELTEKEEKEMNKQAEYFSPSVYPPVVPHPGDDSMKCEETEYPSPEQVAGVLTGRAIVPVILVINGDDPASNKCSGQGGKDLRALQDCPLMFYQEWMQMYGIRGLVRSFSNDSEHSLAAMIQAVLDSAAVICEDPILSTMPPPTRPPSTTSAPSESEDQEPEIVPPAEVSTAEERSTTAPVAPESSTRVSTEVAIPSTSAPLLPDESTGASTESNPEDGSTRVTDATRAPAAETSTQSFIPSLATESAKESSTQPVESDEIASPEEVTTSASGEVSQNKSTHGETIVTDASTEAVTESVEAASTSNIQEPPPAVSEDESEDEGIFSTQEQISEEELLVTTESGEEPQDDATKEASAPQGVTIVSTASSTTLEEVATGEESGKSTVPIVDEGSEPADGSQPSITSNIGESVSDVTDFASDTPLLEDVETTADVEDAPEMSPAEVPPAEIESHSTSDGETVRGTTEGLASSQSTEPYSSFLQRTTPMVTPTPGLIAQETHEPEVTYYTDIEETPSPIYSDFEMATDEASTAAEEAESTTGAGGNKTVVAIASAVGGAGALGAAALLAHTTGIVGSGGAGAATTAAVEAAPETVASRESVQFVSQDMFA